MQKKLPTGTKAKAQVAKVRGNAAKAGAKINKTFDPIKKAQTENMTNGLLKLENERRAKEGK